MSYNVIQLYGRRKLELFGVRSGLTGDGALSYHLLRFIPRRMGRRTAWRNREVSSDARVG